MPQRYMGYLPQMISYAQNFEDVTLRRAFEDQETGFWVDIGANHPVSHSVTKWFSSLGWSGINIEPNPSLLEWLEADRPNEINLGVAVGAEAGRIQLNIIGFMAGLSTIKPDVAAGHAANGIATAAVVEVDLLTLDTILDRHAADRTVDFLKIDVEGAEVDVIAGAALTHHRPRVILLENGGGYDEPLAAKGYRFVWFDGLNRFLVREEEAEVLGPRIAQPPSVWDNFISADLAAAREKLKALGQR